MYGFERNILKYETTKPTDDNIYVDIKLNNNTESRGIIAKYIQTRLESLTANPSNYYLSLIRWKVPGFELPILIFPIEPNQPDINKSEYTVTLETSTDIVQYNLFYVSYNAPTIPPVGGSPSQSSSTYYFMYSYQTFLNILNDALLTAFNTVTGKPVGAEAPYMIYNAATRLFSMIAQQSQYGVDITPSPPNPPTFDAPIKVYFNYKLYSLFSGLPVRSLPENSASSTQGRDIQIIIADFFDNTFNGIYYQIEQDISSIGYWSPVKQIIFVTELLPVNSENTATSSNSYRKILTDFEPIQSSTQDLRASYQYFPQSQYRLIDMIGTKPLYNIDLQVKWLDINGNEYYVLIPPFQQFTAKLLFVKRNLFKTNNLLYDR